MVKDINDVVLQYWRETIRNLPAAVEGEYGRNRLWWACKTVQEMGVPLDLAIQLLAEEYNPRCDPPWHEWEWDFEQTIRNAYGAPPSENRAMRCPEIDRNLRDETVERVNLKMEDFEKLYPSPCDERNPYFFVDRLFPEGNPLLCLGTEKDCFKTKPKTDWKNDLDGVQFIVPSPMSALTGRPKGKNYLSPRTDDNTGPRHYLVIEFDISKYTKEGMPTDDAPFITRAAEKGMSVADINASLIAHLATKAPLVLAVDSGGRSLHGWFRVKDVAETVMESFFRYACRLGADRKLWTPSQMVRLPDGIRDNGKIQQVKYFNPNKI